MMQTTRRIVRNAFSGRLMVLRHGAETTSLPPASYTANSVMLKLSSAPTPKSILRVPLFSTDSALTVCRAEACENTSRSLAHVPSVLTKYTNFFSEGLRRIDTASVMWTVLVAPEGAGSSVTSQRTCLSRRCCCCREFFRPKTLRP